MYFFKNIDKTKLLDGRTITYIAREKVDIMPSFLSAIFSGRRGCSFKTARRVTKAINPEAIVEDYFYEDKEKPRYTKVNKNN